MDNTPLKFGCTPNFFYAFLRPGPPSETTTTGVAMRRIRACYEWNCSDLHKYHPNRCPSLKQIKIQAFLAK